MELQPHQQRVVTEKTELNEKLTKLSAFISSDSFRTIVKDHAERNRLIKQEQIMKEYSEVLTDRIKAFTN
jgi:hypothetical protein